MQPKIKRDTLFLIADVETLSNLAGDKPLVWEVGLALVRGDGLILGSWGSLVNVHDMVGRGFKQTPSTLAWLMSQEAEVRFRFKQACEYDTPTLIDVMQEMTTWIKNTISAHMNQGEIRFPVRNLYLLGRGAAFDCPIMEVLYREVNSESVPLPWLFYNGACLRTFEMIFPVRVPNIGTAHRAEHDALWEAQCLSRQLAVYWQFAGQINAACYQMDTQAQPLTPSELIPLGNILTEDDNKLTLYAKPDTPSAIPLPNANQWIDEYAHTQNDEPCLHQNCPDCHGMFVKSNGEQCVHTMICRCPNCQKECM
ncbi:3'-5' exoribonuclease [Xenorhabdus sp. XENO-10]|uniref:3'-5' exoribonuclease n=1 Tax=Xenorhabdus yunnanensis TaxID=3025878 RepID=A0ABT5LFA5_9GAMM|nr:3'-5' exoribonuclease [Xenorhabdus yunnanensis]MDC9589795.1 3'-5' exoribonuclease [Xenorhabdus yunnanensis]